MWDYSDKVMDHFRNPRNVGKIDEPDGSGTVGSLACGDALTLMFQLDENGRISEARFQTFGCASAIASSSALTEMLIGKSIEEAEKITNRDIADFLGGLPDQKMHCSVMGREALEMAIHNYRTGETVMKQLDDHIVCTCFGISENEIRRIVIENNITNIEDVTNYCKAGGGCGMCRSDIQKIIDKVQEERSHKPAPAVPTQPRPLTNLQKIKMIEEVVEREIRPRLQKDGGDIDLIDIVGNQVIIAFRGMCAGCQSSAFTRHDFIEAKLREFVASDIVVTEEGKED